MGHAMPAEQPEEAPAVESRRGRLGKEPMLSDASRVEELRAESRTMDEWQAAQMKRRIEGITPEKHAQRELYESNDVLSGAWKGELTEGVLETLSNGLQSAWHDLQDQQTELRGQTGPGTEEKLQSNWELIKQLNQMMEVVADGDPAAAKERYQAMQMKKEAREQAAPKTRGNGSRSELQQASMRVKDLEGQIKNTFGVDADMLLSGAKPTQGRMRYMFGSLIGGDMLIKRLREAKQAEADLEEQASKRETSVREKLQIRSAEERYVRKGGKARELARGAASALLPVESTEDREAGAVAVSADERSAEAREHLRRTQRQDARAYRTESKKSVRYGAELEKEYLGDIDEEAKRESSQALAKDYGARRKKDEKDVSISRGRVDRAAEVDQGIRDRLTTELGVNLARPLTDRVDGIMGGDVETQMRKYGFTPGDYYAAFSSYTEAVRDLASMEKAPRDGVYKGAERRVARLRKEIDGYAAKLDINNEIFLGSHRMAENEPVPLTKAKKMGAMPRYELSTDEEEVTQRYARPAPEPSIEATELEGSEAEVVRNIERRSGKLDMDIGRAQEILSQQDAYALWESANAAVTARPGLAKQINGVEKGKDNPATKFVYVLARYADAKNVNADMPQQMILRDHAQELAKALGLENDPIVKKILAQEKRTTQKTAIEAVRRRQARSAASKRSFTNPGM